MKPSNNTNPTDSNKPPLKGAPTALDREKETIARNAVGNAKRDETDSEPDTDDPEVAPIRILDRDKQAQRSPSSGTRPTKQDSAYSKPDPMRTNAQYGQGPSQNRSAGDSESRASRPTDGSNPKKPGTAAAEGGAAPTRGDRETPTKDAVRKAREDQSRSGDHA